MNNHYSRFTTTSGPGWTQSLDNEGWSPPSWQAHPGRISVGHRLWQALGWEETQADVLRESQGRVVLIGRPGAGKRQILARLRGWTATPSAAETLPAVEDQGFWTVIDLPESAEPAWTAPGADAWERVQAADLVMLVTGVAEPEGEPLRWAARVRAIGHPLVAVLTATSASESGRRTLEQRLGQRVIVLPESDGGGGEALMSAIVAACPLLLVPLGRELPQWRRWAARRLMGQTALTCGLWGLEPVPLVDLPVQIAVQTGLALRLLAMYGCVAPSPARREALLLVGGGLVLRLAVAQAARVLPLAGWLVAGATSGLGTWLLGYAMMLSLEQADQRLWSVVPSRWGAL